MSESRSTATPRREPCAEPLERGTEVSRLEVRPHDAPAGAQGEVRLPAPSSEPVPGKQGEPGTGTLPLYDCESAGPSAAPPRRDTVAAHAYHRRMESPHKGKTGFTRLRNALGYSIDGLRAALRHEDAFRQELLAVCILTPIALLLEPSGIGRALMIGSMLIVLVVELLNSAIEAAVDRISFEDHRLAKRAKDIGSAAVLVSLLNVLVMWGLILL